MHMQTNNDVTSMGRGGRESRWRSSNGIEMETLACQKKMDKSAMEYSLYYDLKQVYQDM